MEDSVRPEAKAAAKWWANQLRQKPAQDAGDANLNFGLALFGSLANLQPLIEKQVDTFERELAERIEARCVESNWRPEEPNWCSAFRTIGIDYHPEKIMEEAAKKAGIDGLSFRLPIKTMMWVNPGEVRVGLGYGGTVQTIWKNAP